LSSERIQSAERIQRRRENAEALRESSDAKRIQQRRENAEAVRESS
jgi:hypothetical protein